MNSDVSRAPQRRRTWQREAVRERLEAEGGFVTAQELHRLLEDNGQRIGLATVYRALGTLVADGLADSIRHEDAELYRFCDDDGHHHHIVCRRCGAAEQIEDNEIESWARQVAAEHGYSEPTHVLEVFGLCGNCTKTAEKK